MTRERYNQFKQVQQMLEAGHKNIRIAEQMNLNVNYITRVKQGHLIAEVVMIEGVRYYAITPFQLRQLERERDVLIRYEETQDKDLIQQEFDIHYETLNEILRKHGKNKGRRKVKRIHTTQQTGTGIERDKRLAKKYKPVWDSLLSQPSFMSKALVNYGA